MELRSRIYKPTAARTVFLPSCTFEVVLVATISGGAVPSSRLGGLGIVDPQHSVVQYGALQGGWNGRKLSGNDKLSGLGGTRVNNCTVLIFNYSILFS